MWILANLTWTAGSLRLYGSRSVDSILICHDVLQRGTPPDVHIITHGGEAFMDVRSLQRPLKDQYRQDPGSSKITLKARGSQADAPIACSVDIGRAIYNA